MKVAMWLFGMVSNGFNYKLKQDKICIIKEDHVLFNQKSICHNILISQRSVLLTSKASKENWFVPQIL